MRQVVSILPKRALYRVNLALYAAYAGDFRQRKQGDRGAGARQPVRIPATWRSRRSGRAASTIERHVASYRKGTRERSDASYARFRSRRSRELRRAVLDAAVGSSRRVSAAESWRVSRTGGREAARSRTGLLRFRSRAIAAASRGRRSALANAQRRKIRFLAGARVRRSRRFPVTPRRGGRLGASSFRRSRRRTQDHQGEIALKGGRPNCAIKVLDEANGCSTRGSDTSTSDAPTSRPARLHKPIPNSTAA